MKQIGYAIGSIAVGVFLNFKPHNFEKKADIIFENDTLRNVQYDIERDTINDKLTFIFPTVRHEN